ncbi:Rieske Fe-S protein [Paraburkholderia strydomiana]|nr:Rieske Fe-S protein [Paraburkholderia strydomiana]
MPSDNTMSPSRRKLMQGATAGLMTAVAGHALAQSESSANATGTAGATAPVDPRGLYPHPPFPAQEQPWPGLAGA